MKLSVDQAMAKADKLALKGQQADAAKIYREILQIFPANQRALKGLRALSPVADDGLRQGVQALIALYHQGRPQDVIAQASALLQLYPGAAELHNIAGAAYAGLGQCDEALGSYDRAIQLSPDYADAYNNRGVALFELTRFDEALASYDKALQIMPAHADAHSNRGNALRALKRLDEALASYDRALRLTPDSAKAYYNRGNVLRDLKRFDDALASYENALRIMPGHAEAWNNRGNVLRDVARLEDALASYERALQLKSDYVEAHNNRGVALFDMKRFDEALASHDLARQIGPDTADGHNHRANVLYAMKRFDEALAHYDEALRRKPDHVAAWNNRGNVLRELRRLDEALESYEKALQLKPDDAGALSNVLDRRAQMCAWDDATYADRAQNLRALEGAAPPFMTLAMDDDPSAQLSRARAWARAEFKATHTHAFERRARGDKLRIGYFSADFHDHATMFLMVRMFELHDKSKFEIHAFSNDDNRPDAMRARLLASVDRFHDVRALHDPAAAQLARDCGIDVAVDLKGYTRDGRAGVFAHRAAPVQISYLGYPGSMGAAFMDYIIADKVVLPETSQRFYDEKVIYLPHSYQVNDNQRFVSERSFARSQLGLPESGFVFCCFNNNFKLSPAEFDVWMRLLGAVEGSVLWLLKDNAWVEANLRRHAETRGVDPARLVFAERMPLAEHLARHRCADLFLDTFNYNAHTTASDALWAGLPVLTKLGESFAARVAGSLLHAVGMPELATDTVAAYEALALELARNPERLAALRGKLAANRLTAPLFDSARFTRDIERAYELAFQRHADGLAPDHVEVR